MTVGQFLLSCFHTAAFCLCGGGVGYVFDIVLKSIPAMAPNGMLDVPIILGFTISLAMLFLFALFCFVIATCPWWPSLRREIHHDWLYPPQHD